MLVIGIGMVILIFMIYVSVKNKHYDDIILILLTCIGLTILILCIVPSGDYGEWTQERTIILTELEENSDEVKYVKDLPNEVIFNYESESKITKTENRLVEIIETDGEEAYMLIETRQGKAQILLTFTPKPMQTKYVFYVPKGTVIDKNIEEFEL